jgi:hypothetical protein
MRRTWRGSGASRPEAGAALLFGIVQTDGVHGRNAPDGIVTVAFRGLGALVGETSYARVAPTPEQVTAYRQIVEGVFAERSILPAPFGTVFRNREGLTRWLELHYFTLIEALTFVEDRVMARVTIATEPRPEVVNDPGTAQTAAALLEATATESFRLLRRHAVASLVAPKAQPEVVQSSFLIDREKWGLFADIVGEEQKRFPDLSIEHSGPWPPYDFVRMEFGG